MQCSIYSGTRADFGKLAPIIDILIDELNVDVTLYVGGIHWLPEFGTTGLEAQKKYNENVTIVSNFNNIRGNLSALAAETLSYFASAKFDKGELCIVHGDRADALAFSIASKTSNCSLLHIEGGEKSGSIDNLYRNAITQLSDFHIVAKAEYRSNLIQMAINEDSAFVLPSPEIMNISDVSLAEVQGHYDLTFKDYGIVLMHPDTTDKNGTRKNIDELVGFLQTTKRCFYILHPNFDDGYEYFFETLRAKNIHNFKNIHIIKNMRFGSYQCLLKSSKLNIGNSSSFVREAPRHGNYSLILGGRQDGRVQDKNVVYLNSQANNLQDLSDTYWGKTLSSALAVSQTNKVQQEYKRVLEQIIKCINH